MFFWKQTLLPSQQPSMPPISFQISEKKFPSIWEAGSYLQGNRIPGGPEVTHTQRRSGLRERSWSPENRSAQEQNSAKHIIMAQHPKEDITASMSVPHPQEPGLSTTPT